MSALSLECFTAHKTPFAGRDPHKVCVAVRLYFANRIPFFLRSFSRSVYNNVPNNEPLNFNVYTRHKRQVYKNSRIPISNSAKNIPYLHTFTFICDLHILLEIQTTIYAFSHYTA